ncbi:MAG TPA: GNAT family N-acetyltransferase [Bryobacteraceae bacterium]|jgi:ribosomal protein S18 acetylase RimI-like enzyme
MPKIEISEMTMADYDAMYALLSATPGIGLRLADSHEGIERYLARNPGLSFVARSEGRIVGCVMSGHDGRRGYLQHLAVDPAFRLQGIGRALIERCLERLQAEGIEKTHLDILAGNFPAHRYWTKLGWKKRDDIVRYSFTKSDLDNL